MIAFVEGHIEEITPTYVVLNCNGVGYFLHISLNTYSKIKDNKQCRLLSHLNIREDAHVLYGFADIAERDIFRHLISVSGIGPGTARVIISSMTPDEIQTAITSANVTALQKIKGIGEKTAQRIIVDLKDKISKTPVSKDIFGSTGLTLRNEALTALITLGFAKPAAEKALDKVAKTFGNSISLENLIKESLKHL